MASLVALLTRVMHADTITPVELRSAVVSSPAAKAFAKYGLARLPQLSFRGLHDVHPKISACIIAKLPKATLYTRYSSKVRYLPFLPDC